MTVTGGGNDLAAGGDDRAVDTRTPTAVPFVPAPRRAPEARTVPGARTPGRAPAARATPRLGWLELGVAAVAYVTLLVLLDAVADDLGLTTGPVLAVVSIGAALGAVAVALAVRSGSLAALPLAAPRPVMLLAGVAAGLATYAAARAAIAVWIAVGGTLPAAQPGLWTFSGAGSAVALVVLVGLVVPVAEELLFRGVAVAALSRHGLLVAATGSAVLFAAAHGLAVVAVAALALGLVNAVMVWRWRTIWPGVAAHATFNLVSVALTLAS